MPFRLFRTTAIWQLTIGAIAPQGGGLQLLPWLSNGVSTGVDAGGSSKGAPEFTSFGPIYHAVFADSEFLQWFFSPSSRRVLKAVAEFADDSKPGIPFRLVLCVSS